MYVHFTPEIVSIHAYYTLNKHGTLFVNGQNRKLNAQIHCLFNIED
jgi:phage replication-related protein YjqB (UPF0714/DUF867 family)